MFVCARGTHEYEGESGEWRGGNAEGKRQE